MRRWNGWGDTTIDYPTPEGATEFLEQWVGKISPPNHEGCNLLSGRSRKNYLKGNKRQKE